jgi:hypothetical protein
MYLKTIFYFTIPLLLICVFISIIDPYNFINLSKLIDDEHKFKVVNRSLESQPRGNMLWKIVKYRRNPCKNIIIGDSQAYHIREELILSLTGDKYFNFCIPGGSIETIISTFWFAANQTKLDKVYLQIPFINNEAYQRPNLFSTAYDYIENPFLYFFNKDIIIDSYYNFGYKLTKNPTWIKNQFLSSSIEEKDKISEKMLDVIYKDYSYSEKEINELKKVATYCKINNIKLQFIILPCYKRINEFLSERDLIHSRDRFLNDIKLIGKTYDFFTDQNFTNYRSNYTDYYHPISPVSDKITIKIWGK